MSTSRLLASFNENTSNTVPRMNSTQQQPEIQHQQQQQQQQQSHQEETQQQQQQSHNNHPPQSNDVQRIGSKIEFQTLNLKMAAKLEEKKSHLMGEIERSRNGRKEYKGILFRGGRGDGGGVGRSLGYRSVVDTAEEAESVEAKLLKIVKELIKLNMSDSRLARQLDKMADHASRMQQRQIEMQQQIEARQQQQQKQQQHFLTVPNDYSNTKSNSFTAASHTTGNIANLITADPASHTDVSGSQVPAITIAMQEEPSTISPPTQLFQSPISPLPLLSPLPLTPKTADVYVKNRPSLNNRLSMHQPAFFPDMGPIGGEMDDVADDRDNEAGNSGNDDGGIGGGTGGGIGEGIGGGISGGIGDGISGGIGGGISGGGNDGGIGGGIDSNGISKYTRYEEKVKNENEKENEKANEIRKREKIVKKVNKARGSQEEVWKATHDTLGNVNAEKNKKEKKGCYILEGIGKSIKCKKMSHCEVVDKGVEDDEKKKEEKEKEEKEKEEKEKEEKEEEEKKRKEKKKEEDEKKEVKDDEEKEEKEKKEGRGKGGKEEEKQKKEKDKKDKEEKAEREEEDEKKNIDDGNHGDEDFAYDAIASEEKKGGRKNDKDAWVRRTQSVKSNHSFADNKIESADNFGDFDDGEKNYADGEDGIGDDYDDCTKVKEDNAVRRRSSDMGRDMKADGGADAVCYQIPDASNAFANPAPIIKVNLKPSKPPRSLITSPLQANLSAATIIPSAALVKTTAPVTMTSTIAATTAATAAATAAASSTSSNNTAAWKEALTESNAGKAINHQTLASRANNPHLSDISLITHWPFILTASSPSSTPATSSPLDSAAANSSGPVMSTVINFPASRLRHSVTQRSSRGVEDITLVSYKALHSTAQEDSVGVPATKTSKQEGRLSLLRSSFKRHSNRFSFLSSRNKEGSADKSEKCNNSLSTNTATTTSNDTNTTHSDNKSPGNFVTTATTACNSNSTTNIFTSNVLRLKQLFDGSHHTTHPSCSSSWSRRTSEQEFKKAEVTAKRTFSLRRKNKR